MYIFVDEYGNLAPTPLGATALNERIFMLGALVIGSNRSLRRVSVAISRAQRAQLRTPQHSKCKQCARELKGDHILDHVRRKLFKRIAKLPDVQFYCILIDKDRLRQPLIKLCANRYNRAVANLLARMPFPRQLRRVFLVIDKGGGGRARVQRQTLSQLFKNAIKQRATHVVVRVRDSHSDRCLQAVDLLTNFASQGFRFRIQVHEEKQQLERGVMERSRFAKRLSVAERRLRAWGQVKNSLRYRMHLWQIPPRRLYTRSLRRLVRARIAAMQDRKRNEANRRG
jgi:hypothetical protein